MTTIWNYRGDHRALWAVIASIVASYVLAMRLARWGESWQWVPLALPVAVLLIWFFLARAGVRDLGFPARGDRSSPAAGPLGGAVALLAGAVGAGLVAYGVLGGAGAAELPVIGAGSSGLFAMPGGGSAIAATAVLAACAAAAAEVVFHGALLRLAASRWSPRAAVAVAAGLSVLGLLPLMLTQTEGTWSWLAATACAVLVPSVVLGWAAVRTGALWMSLGWAAGVTGAGAAVLQGWPTQAADAWAAAGAAAAAGVLLILVVLLLERVGPSRSSRHEV